MSKTRSFPLVSNDGQGTYRAMARDRIEFAPDGQHDCVVTLVSSGCSCVVNAMKPQDASVSVRCSKRELRAAAKAMLEMCGDDR